MQETISTLYVIRAEITASILDSPGNRASDPPSPAVHYALGPESSALPSPPSYIIEPNLGLSCIPLAAGHGLLCPHSFVRCHGVGRGHSSSQLFEYLGSKLRSTE